MIVNANSIYIPMADSSVHMAVVKHIDVNGIRSRIAS